MKNELEYFGKYVTVFNDSYEYEYNIKNNNNNLNYIFNQIATNASDIFELTSNQKLKVKFSDNEIHHLEIDCAMFANLRGTENARADLSLSVRRNGLANGNDNLNYNISEAQMSLKEQYTVNEMHLHQSNYTVKNGDILDFNLNCYYYGTENTLRIIGAVVNSSTDKLVRTQLNVKVID